VSEDISVIISKALESFQEKKIDQAKTLLEKVLKIDSNNFDALHILGVILIINNQFDQGISYFKKAISINSQNAFVYFNYGKALSDMENYVDALTQYEESLKINPNNVEALLNKAIVLNFLRKHDEAIKICVDIIKFNSKNFYVWYNLGIFYDDIENHKKAIESYDQAILLKPDFVFAYYNKGNSLMLLKNFKDSLINFKKAFDLDPNINFLLGNLIFVKLLLCDWSFLNHFLDECSKRVSASEPVITPFQMILTYDNPELQKICTKIYTKEKLKRENFKYPIEIKKKERIKIGYFSADFHNHATCHLMAELFEEHDKNKFDIFGFSFGPKTNDEMQKRVIAAFKEFFDVRFYGDAEIIKLSKKIGIDIAVDLQGLTKDSRIKIFANRCAPIQVNFLGYPGTINGEIFDYIIADKFIVPTEHQKFFFEKVVYLPDSYQVNDSKRQISRKNFCRKDLSLPEKGFVFCCFNNTFKILPNIFDVWMNILKSVDESVLWLLVEDKNTSINILRETKNRGVDVDRIIFAKRLDLELHLARIKCADLCLDTFPCNSHTTASDALFSGVPILTCSGKSFASRVAGSLLYALQLPELVTENFKDYEIKAIDLANNKSKLLRIKEILKKNILKSNLFNGKIFARHIEAAYEEMFLRKLNKLNLSEIIVKKIN